MANVIIVLILVAAVGYGIYSFIPVSYTHLRRGRQEKRAPRGSFFTSMR